jgi:hypothetical protein
VNLLRDEEYLCAGGTGVLTRVGSGVAEKSQPVGRGPKAGRVPLPPQALKRHCVIRAYLLHKIDCRSSINPDPGHNLPSPSLLDRGTKSMETTLHVSKDGTQHKI